MDIKENVSLKDYSTMRLGGQARYLVEVANQQDLPRIVEWANQQNLPFMMIGQGSNIIWRDEGYEGLLIINKIKGRKVLQEDADNATLEICAGEVWDEAVAWTVEQNLSGIEFLSLIPGYVGGAPVQNIGAYGGELADILTEVNVYDTQKKSFEIIAASDCGFGYRTSRFKVADKGRFLIISIVLRLKKQNPAPPFYESLQKYLTSQGVSTYTPEVIRQAVIAIRRAKLPDPSVVANNGSFFTNPIITKEQFDKLQADNPELKGWPYKSDQVKISAAWLIDKAGFKDTHDQATGMATWPAQSLVLINEHAQKTADLLDFKEQITDKVNQLFDIKLAQEPELLP